MNKNGHHGFLVVFFFVSNTILDVIFHSSSNTVIKTKVFIVSFSLDLLQVLVVFDLYKVKSRRYWPIRFVSIEIMKFLSETKIVFIICYLGIFCSIE